MSRYSRLSNPFVDRLLYFAPYVAAAIIAGAAMLAGCERKERVIDVEGPGVNIEVDRNKDTGRIEVDVERDK